eukprot:COSAG01_NODE_1751_length_9323_cov_5.197507_8_plen_116_part_00
MVSPQCWYCGQIGHTKAQCVDYHLSVATAILSSRSSRGLDVVQQLEGIRKAMESAVDSDTDVQRQLKGSPAVAVGAKNYLCLGTQQMWFWKTAAQIEEATTNIMRVKIEVEQFED